MEMALGLPLFLETSQFLILPIDLFAVKERQLLKTVILRFQFTNWLDSKDKKRKAGSEFLFCNSESKAS